MQILDGMTPNKRLGGGGGGPTIPSDIAGLLFWFKTPIAGAVDGLTFATWPDSSGNGRDATNGGAGIVYHTNIINGLAVVQTTAANFDLSSTALGTAHTVFLVLRPLVGFTDGVYLGGAVIGMYTPYIDATDVYYRPIITDAFVNVAHGGLSTNTPYLIEIVRNGTSVSFYKDAAQLSTAQTLSANTALSVNDVFGVAGGNLSPNNVQVAEIFVYDSALSTSDRQAMETYISNRYAFF